MKLLLVLMLCGLAAAAAVPSVQKKDIFMSSDIGGDVSAMSEQERNILINALIRQLINYLRYVINNGSEIFGIPPLDPFVLDNFDLNIPTSIINLRMKIKHGLVTGFGSFETPLTNLNLNDFSFDVEFVFPELDLSAVEYDLVGDLFNAIPLYGNGPARFYLENFKVKAKIFLKQSDDETSILIDRIENASYEIPVFKSELYGVIGGGDIDAIVNAIVEDVIIDYVNRFQGATAALTSFIIVPLANPILNTLDTWKYIAPFVPRD